ncbi:MAG TPA: hypothetical protein VK614_14335 [Allosphingosinicella sp.]|nr:hypothetical protein [Allosphingosinicella sp.]
MVKILSSIGLVLALASPAVAQRAPAMSGTAHQGYYLAGAIAPGQLSARAHAFGRLQSQLHELRRQGLALREADGGTLTPEHLAFIQERLDAAQAAYRPYRFASR